MSTDVRDSFITLNGLRFHYRDWGAIEAPPVVLLHGSGFAAGSYDILSEGLADQYRVLALDQRGHGESEWADDYRWERAVEDLTAFVSTLGLAGVTLVGHSGGARIAAAFAGSHPDAVRRLVLLDWAPGAVFSPEFARTLASVLLRPVTSAIDEPVTALRSALPRLQEEAIRHAVESNLTPRRDGGWTWRFDPTVLRDGVAFQIDEATAEALVRQVTCPTLLVWASHSEMLSREQAIRTLNLLSDGHLVELPNAGHSLPWERPDAVLTVVRSFLLGISMPQSAA